MTDNDTATIPETDTLTAGEECLIRAGDEFAFADRPDLRVTVARISTDHGIFVCSVRTPAGEYGFARPWHLVPAEGATEHWHQRMRELYAAQRAHASDLVRRRHHELADQAEAIARQFIALACAVRQGGLPDPDPATFAAEDFLHAVQDLRDLRGDLVYAQVLAADDPAPPDHEHEPQDVTAD
ncbi:hypothetical protein [Nocardia miyunensis]|uniref:hypothetical protein n=1 Tax=Nocardia miyunensis TaxID=282684 RepID=UPI000833E80F|nr:hypothetical protein [Nocardia miyunensis]